MDAVNSKHSGIQDAETKPTTTQKTVILSSASCRAVEGVRQLTVYNDELISIKGNLYSKDVENNQNTIIGTLYNSLQMVLHLFCISRSSQSGISDRLFLTLCTELAGWSNDVTAWREPAV